MEVIAELLEFFIVKLCSVIKYDGVKDSISTDYLLVDKLFYGRDGCERFYFNPFSEVVENHYYVLYITSSFGESAN